MTDQDSTPGASRFDLRPMAFRAMEAAGFATRTPPDVERELRRRRDENEPGAARDLRSLLWSSIDNPESRDLDQVEFALPAPNDAIRLLVGIADVDAFVPQGSATDRYAFQNATSVYTGIATFPMLPERLSEDQTSLLEGEDRRAIVVDMVISAEGAVESRSVYRARVRNQAKLTYEGIAAWLEQNADSGEAPLPPEAARLPGLEEQLRLQNTVTQRLLNLRLRSGALDFETIEASPVTVGGEVVGLTVTPKNRARYLIESFMVTVNNTVAELLGEHGVASIQRVVRTPKRWDRIVSLAGALGEHLPPEPDSRALADFLTRRRLADPLRFPDLSLSVVKLMGAGEYAVVRRGATEEGHFGLAVQGYSHSTAPNRRYADLVTQRLLKAMIDSAPPPYTVAALEEIAARCTERASAARKVERTLRKAAAAVLLQPRIGNVFAAIVTGASGKGVYVRLLDPPAEGRVLRGEEGLDVGDSVRVRLLAANPETGFIDFAALPS